MAENVTIELMWLRVAAVGVPSSVKIGCILLSDSMFLSGYASLHLVRWGTQIWRQCVTLIASNAVRTACEFAFENYKPQWITTLLNSSPMLCVCACVCVRASFTISHTGIRKTFRPKITRPS